MRAVQGGRTKALPYREIYNGCVYCAEARLVRIVGWGSKPTGKEEFPDAVAVTLL